ncbi:MAG: hypothetical protein ACRC0A_04880 [Chitinophagaceae bacterium]
MKSFGLMDNLTARLKKFMEHENLNKLRFSDILGYSHSEKISRLFRKENAMPSVEILQDISYKFENLNIEWLLTGKGSMLRDAQPTTPTPSLPAQSVIARATPEATSPCPELLAENTQLKVQVQLLESHNKELKEHIEDLRSSNQYFQKILNQATVVEAIKEDVSQKHKLKTTH